MFFNKPKAKFNLLNDLDSDVFNLFQVLISRKEELLETFKLMPIHADLWEHWRNNQESDPILKALRFLLFSNFGYMGKPETMLMQISNSSQIILDNIENTYQYLFGCIFSNQDFRELFKKIAYRDDIQRTFIYADPPYLNTTNNYQEGFKEQDVTDLMDTLISTNCKFAYSEFDNPFVIEQAKERGLVINTIGERLNMKNRRIEILITNYKKELSLFD